MSLHLPLTDATRHFIGERELRLMQPHSYLVNLSRGGTVDEAALVRALSEGWIRGAGIDVFAERARSRRASALLDGERGAHRAHRRLGDRGGAAPLRRHGAGDANGVRGERPWRLVNPEALRRG